MPSNTAIPKAPLPHPEEPNEEFLSEACWQEKRRRHHERLGPRISDQLTRSAAGKPHPVYDFLFSYYSHRPGQLRKWHPGLGKVLMGSSATEFIKFREYSNLKGGIGADLRKFPPARRESVRWICQLLRNCTVRPPQFGCFGLHEWAMVYRTEKIRHPHPLRLSDSELAEIVETLPIRCSHFDAFRFFTAAARPLNQLQPTKETQPVLEQRGCLHVNMDLYKWAFKLSPWTPSDLVADAFLLAVRIREIDMRASPYDLRELGFEPIRIETPEGRREYEHWQRQFAAEGEPIRARLIESCERILAGLDELSAETETKTEHGLSSPSRQQKKSG